jgi:hypothetical protein
VIQKIRKIKNIYYYVFLETLNGLKRVYLALRPLGWVSRAFQTKFMETGLNLNLELFGTEELLNLATLYHTSPPLSPGLIKFVIKRTINPVKYKNASTSCWFIKALFSEACRLYSFAKFK